MGASYDIDDTIRRGASIVPKTVKINEIKNFFIPKSSYINIVCFFSNISFSFHGCMWQILKKKKMATHTKVYKMSQYVS